MLQVTDYANIHEKETKNRVQNIIRSTVGLKAESIKKTRIFFLYIKCFQYINMQYNMKFTICTLCPIFANTCFRFFSCFQLFCMKLSVPSLTLFLCFPLLPFRVPSLWRNLQQDHIATVFTATSFIKGKKTCKQYKFLLMCMLGNILTTQYGIEIKNE